jgi:hypothetical protein
MRDGRVERKRKLSKSARFSFMHSGVDHQGALLEARILDLLADLLQSLFLPFGALFVTDLLFGNGEQPAALGGRDLDAVVRLKHLVFGAARHEVRQRKDQANAIGGLSRSGAE